MTEHAPIERLTAFAAPLALSLEDHTAAIVSAYVARNAVPAADLPKLIETVHGALASLLDPSIEPKIEMPTQAQIKKSITHEALISFEDGKPYKTLRRHLTMRGISPEAYRTKWGLPKDYPLVAAAYSEARSQLAISLGLGQQRRKDRSKPAA